VTSAHILRDRFAGQVSEVFQDIDVLLVPVWNTPITWHTGHVPRRFD
jgi:hypothetical protein